MNREMMFREAAPSDIDAMSRVRLAVRENMLSDPSLVTVENYRDMLTERGRGWVCEVEGQIVGFAVVDVLGKNVWALFVLPAFEKMGIGKKLHDMMVGWAFGQGLDSLWLSTGPGTRAEGFYRKIGWKETGVFGKGELKFELYNIAEPLF